MLYVNIEQMINEIKFKSVSMKKRGKNNFNKTTGLPIVLFNAKFLVDIENMLKM